MATGRVSAELARSLAELVGLSIDDASAAALAIRFEPLLRQIDLLRQLDLEGVEPAFWRPFGGRQG